MNFLRDRLSSTKGGETDRERRKRPLKPKLLSLASVVDRSDNDTQRKALRLLTVYLFPSVNMELSTCLRQKRELLQTKTLSHKDVSTLHRKRQGGPT